MFYLINEKDGVTDNKDFLVNVIELYTLESAMSKGLKGLEITFTFARNHKHLFPVDKDSCFNVNQVIDSMNQLEPVSYKNPVIALTDSQNMNSLNHNQFYIHKFSKILININSIELVFVQTLKEGNTTMIVTKEKRIIVNETPQEIFDIINSKVI